MPDKHVLCGLDKAPRVVRKMPRTALNKRPQSLSGSSKDLQQPAKRESCHLLFLYLSNFSFQVLALSFAYLLALFPYQLPLLQFWHHLILPSLATLLDCSALIPSPVDEPAVVPEVVEPSAAVKPVALSGFGKATSPLAAVTGMAV